MALSSVSEVGNGLRVRRHTLNQRSTATMQDMMHDMMGRMGLIGLLLVVLILLAIAALIKYLRS